MVFIELGELVIIFKPHREREICISVEDLTLIAHKTIVELILRLAVVAEYNPGSQRVCRIIGKVGQFCPIKPGCGGGILLRETENKKTGEKGYAAATGSKGFRWLESEMVKQLDKQGDIDRGYYNNMVDEAVKSLSVYGDFERFAADEPYVSDNTPPWFGAGEPHEEDTTPFDVR